MFIRDKKYEDKIESSLKYIKTLEKTLACGRYDLHSGIYYGVDEYFTKEFGYPEVHRKYIDLQYILEGEEIIYVTNISDCSGSKGYDEARDIEFFENSANSKELIMKTGDWAVFYPDDAHTPQIILNKSSKVKKIVVKIPV